MTETFALTHNKTWKIYFLRVKHQTRNNFLKGESRTDHYNVIVFIWATDHMITMLCQVTNNYGMHKPFLGSLISIDSGQILPGQIFWLIFTLQFYLVFKNTALRSSYTVFLKYNSFKYNCFNDVFRISACMRTTIILVLW